MPKRTTAELPTPPPTKPDHRPESTFPLTRWPQLTTRPVMVVGIDPGDVHCGIAIARVEYDPASHEGTITLTRAEEQLPDHTADLLAAWLLEGWVDAVAVERFNLDPGKALEQSGSAMETSQLIGVLRYVVRLANRGRRDQGVPEVRLYLQGRDIKKATRGHARARGIELISAPTDHPRDAQLHAVHCAAREVLGWGQ